MSRVLGESWLLPALDRHNRVFFTAGVLTLQQCERCKHIQHPPDDVCESCQSFELGHFRSAGRGRIESVAVVTQAVHPLLADRVPYAIGDVVSPREVTLSVLCQPWLIGAL